MSTQGQQSPVASPIYRTERVIASLVMAWVIILTTYMIFQDHALSHASMYFLKIILSLSGAVMLATLPGFMDVNYTIGGFSVRAAGGAAAFVFIYTQSPNLPALKLDPAQARPAQQEPARTSETSSQLTDEFPILVSISLIAPDLLFSSASYSASGGFGGGVDINPPGSRPPHTRPPHTRPPLGSGPGRISVIEAVRGDITTVVVTVINYARGAASQALVLLDAAAAALRAGVSHVAATVSDLLGVLKTLGGTPQQGIALVSENLTARTDELVSGLLNSEGQPTEALFGLVDSLTAGFSGNGPNSVGGVAGSIGGTVEGLTTAVQGRVNNLLATTTTLGHGVTDLLDGATGGLTAGLTPVANKLVGGIATATGQVVDGITPVVAKTASQAWGGVGDGLDKLTERLNAMTPSLVGGIDKNLLDGNALLPSNALDYTPSLPLDKFGGPLGKLGGNDGGMLPGGGTLGIRGSERNLFANKFADPLGGESLSAGPGCQAGCGGRVLSGVGGALNDTASRLGVGQGRLLGALDGGAKSGARFGGASGGGLLSGDASGSLSSGGAAGANPAAGMGRDAPASGGPIASTVGATRSLVGGATRGLGLGRRR